MRKKEYGIIVVNMVEVDKLRERDDRNVPGLRG